jgi:hypothetical protein
MNTHPYLRAYLAGIFVPTLVLPLLLTVFIVVRIVLKAPVPIEQAMIFPMAVVPCSGCGTCSGLGRTRARTFPLARMEPYCHC